MNLRSIKKLPAVYRALSFARRSGGRAWMRAMRRIKGIQKNTVLFTSFKGKSYSDSPRYISEALHALRPDIDIAWQIANPADVPDYVRPVKPHSLAALTEMATARCFVDNFNRPIYLEKYAGQLYVQTWHGDRGFKKVLYDMPDPLPYPDGEQIDLAVSGSAFGTGVYRTAFRYSGEVMQVGMPRNDMLVKGGAEFAAKVRKRVGVGTRKVMLYAPTFRDATAGKAQEAGFDIAAALDALGEGWVCLTRAHDLNRGIASAASDRVFDVTGYPEMAELLLIADLLVTDYSSSAGDFVLTGRPAILYQPDLDEFIGSDRNMYFDIRKSPYLRAECESELLSMLSRVDVLPAAGESVLSFYGATESGDSAAQVARWIADRVEALGENSFQKKPN